MDYAKLQDDIMDATFTMIRQESEQSNDTERAVLALAADILERRYEARKVGVAVNDRLDLSKMRKSPDCPNCRGTGTNLEAYAMDMPTPCYCPWVPIEDESDGDG